MGFTLSRKIIESELMFYREKEAFSGVEKIAEKVKKDISLVFGIRPESTEKKEELKRYAVIYGTIGKSPILDELDSAYAKAGNATSDREAAGSIRESEGLGLNRIRGKREVYLFKAVDRPFDNVEKAIIIAGSDKRGTIYGLFHLSELLSVSPLVDWCGVKPVELSEYCFEENYEYISKEPSVRFRGFFINDEWPAFGNWCNKNFGGFNAEAYDHVFELLLRLKGNYLWPAMWSAIFPNDGPGLKNAELADEYGVVMGMSHHEPCLRQGEEYKYLRGKDSIYGDAWNFRVNEKGITKFWEDGLKRSGKFENVITVGMRGEADTAIMGKNATLADNIELLRDVLKTQRRLIRENVNEDLSKVPRMIALYKEVEEFFYGNEEAKGLMGSEELEDVILMLCDDNFGNLRTLPTDSMRDHKGGYGMYYHFDYHGWPISFEWINSSFLPKVWEEMTMAYDFNIRELWIVNVGDICTQEFPLSYFMDLAYDFDKWGTKAINTTEAYTKEWIAVQFNGVFDEAGQAQIFDLLHGYTKLAQKRRPEAMNTGVYSPVNYKETECTLKEIDRLITLADSLYRQIGTEDIPAYFSLVYYPAVGTLNIYRMWLYTELNNYFAKLGIMDANNYAAKIKECMERDRSIVEEYHTIADGKWYGMGLSEHIGFKNWNEDECQNPVVMQVIPADKERILLSVDGTEQHAEGSFWLNTKLNIDAFLEPDVTEATFTLYNITDKESCYVIKNDIPYLTCSETASYVETGLYNTATDDGEDIVYADETVNDGCMRQIRGRLGQGRSAKKTYSIRLDEAKRANLTQGEGDRISVTEGSIRIQLPAGECTVSVPVAAVDTAGLPEKTYINTKGYIAIEAERYIDSGMYDGAEFRVIRDFGKTLSGVKAFPADRNFEPGEAPYVEYGMYMQKGGEYEAELYMQPSNAVTTENRLCYAVSVNGSEVRQYNVIPEGERVGDQNYTWAAGVLNNIRRHTVKLSCNEGLNRLRIYAVTPGFVLEKLVIFPVGHKPAEAYLGPAETYYVGR